MAYKHKPLTFDELKGRILGGERAKAGMARQWYVNTAFFKGQQWPAAGYMAGDRFVHTTQRTAPQPITKNYLQPIVLMLAAKLTQNRPVWDAKPASPETSDKQVARYSQFMLEREWDRLDMPQGMYASAIDMLLTGQMIWAVYWDDEAGHDITIHDPMTGEKIGTKRSGAPVVDQVHPMDYGMDPLAATAKSARWCYRIRLVTKQWITSMLNERVNLKGDSLSGGTDEISHRMEQSPILTAQWDDTIRRDMLPLYEFYDMDRATVSWFTRDRIVHQQAWDQGNPFIFARAIPNIGDIEGEYIGSNAAWGETPVSQMIPIQRELNICATQIRDITNRLIQPTLLVPNTANMDMSLLSTGRARYLPWSGHGHRPEPMHIGAYPTFLNNREATLIQDLREVVAVNEVSMGGAQGSNPSGRTVALQADQDAQKFGPYVRALQDAAAELGRRVLNLWHDYGQEVIMLNAMGPSGDLEYMAFKASDLNPFSVSVVTGSMFAQNKALRMDQILQMWQLQIEKDPRKIKRLLEFGTVEELMGGSDADRLRQRREIVLLKKGAPIPVEPWDVHDLHLEELDEWLKSEDYEMAPPDIQQVGREHWQAHKDMQTQAAMTAQMGDGSQVQAMMGARTQGNSPGLNPADEANPGAAPARE